MATLQRIRNHSVALLVIVGLAMAAFIIGDLLTSSSSIMQSNRDKVVTVNGKKVTYEEFETERNRKQEFIKAMYNQDLDNAATEQLTQQVYNEFVTKLLLNEACEETGLAVTPGEVNEMVQGTHTATVLKQLFGEENAKAAGQFFTNVIVNDSWEDAQQQMPFATQNNWAEIEDQIKLVRTMEKYNALVAAAVKPNKLEAQDNFAGDNEQATFAYVRKSAYTVADSLVKVSDSDLKDYYQATKRLYKNADMVSVAYIAVPLRPSQADFKAVLSDMEAVKDEFRTAADISDLVNSNSEIPYVDAFVRLSTFEGDVKTFVENGGKDDFMEPALQDGSAYVMARIIDKTVAPDSFQVELMMFADKARYDSVASLKLTVDSVFTKAALTANENPQLAQQAGRLGWMNEVQLLNQLGKDLRDKVVATPRGSLFTYESDGVQKLYYIGRVTDLTAPVQKAKVALYANSVTPSSTTRRDEYGKLNNFLTEFSTVKAMRDSARARGFNMLETNVYTNSYTVGRVEDARQAVRFAFENDLNTVSEIYECGDNLLVVAPVRKVEAGYMSLKDTTFQKQIRNMGVLPLKKVEYLVEKAKTATDKSLAGYAAVLEADIDTAKFVNFNLGSISGLGNEPAVVASALKAQTGELVGPIAGKNNVVVLQLIEKAGKDLPYDEAARLQAVASSRDYSAVARPVSTLQQQADIEDYRVTFY